jgi:NADPH2:quinone reductase
MKAAYIDAPGPPDAIRYGDLPDPLPGPGEVLVRVGSVAVNPIDLYIRAGTVPMPLPKPFIIGCDLAGTVVGLGPHAGRYKIGDRVWGSNQGLLGRQGTFSQLAAVHEDWLYPTPPGVTDNGAAAAALTSITAHLGLFQYGHLKAGETVFVNGGTGGVGSVVVQLTKAAGAKVVTTVGSAEKAQLARSLGADLVLDYRTDDVSAGVKDFTGGKGVDLWFETQREFELIRTVDLVAQRGRIILVAGRQARPVFPVGPFYLKGLSMHGFAMFNATAAEQQACSLDLNTWLASGQLKPAIGRTFPLSEAAAAHRLLDENTHARAGTLFGKVVLEVPK